jgi:protein-S-isoprenylcysteine O-methyltransferase Ste14
MTTSALETPPKTWRRWSSPSQDAALVLVSAFFFYSHLRHLLVDGSVTGLGFTIEQGILVGMFLMRRRSIATTTRPFDWIVATGSWLPMFMRPADSPTDWAVTMGVVLQTIGVFGTSIAFLSLGRSFGIVAANRGLKRGGPYRLVRHPIYLGHLVTGVGFTLANWSPLNLTLLLIVTGCQVFRIRAEERVLTDSDDYAEYAQRVRWRLVPGLF